jgi:hypothetical protein
VDVPKRPSEIVQPFDLDVERVQMISLSVSLLLDSADRSILVASVIAGFCGTRMVVSSQPSAVVVRGLGKVRDMDKCVAS